MGPIGIFDSGYGGLTILEAIRKRLPHYDYLYLGDNARSPYGTRSYEVVYEYTLEAVKELFERGCELVILACNTASAKALRSIQQRDLPNIDPNKRVLGVIRPSAEVIGTYTKSGHIGILATKGTVNSNSYVIEIGHFAPDCKVSQHPCPMWVPLIENNEHLSIPGREFIKNDVNALLSLDGQIDTIVLGCTHYPLVQDQIEEIVPKGVTVVAQGDIVAASLQDYLKRHPEMDQLCTKNGVVTYLTTENSEEFDRNAAFFIGGRIHSQHIML
jgi:glutamate racemase